MSKDIYYKNNINNAIFDDYNGNMITKPGDNLAARYEILKDIGNGAYGKVVKVLDHKYNKNLAIKIINSQSKYFNTGVHECDMLINLYKWYKKAELNFNDDFIPLMLKKYFQYNNHICLVFNLYEIDLYRYTNNNVFKYTEIVKISKDIFKALHFLKQNKLVHGDLKPENIMLTNDLRAVVIDYGLSFFETKNVIDIYIQTRYYRAPEVYFNLPINCTIDIWSMGCILYEMYYRRPLFKGKNEVEMINSYISCLDLPNKKYIKKVIKSTKNYINLQNYKNSHDNKLIDNINNNKINDLIRLCIKYESETRIIPDNALLHIFFNK